MVSMELRDFNTIILKVDQTNPDAILFSSQTGTTGLVFIKQARERGLEIPIFTTFTTVVNEDAKDVAGEALDGTYFYDPSYDEEKFVTLEQAYKTRSANPAIPFHSAAAYDSARMIIEAINEVGNDGKLIRDWLINNIQGWEGYAGTLSLDERGNTDLGFTLKVVDGESFRKVE